MRRRRSSPAWAKMPGFAVLVDVDGVRDAAMGLRAEVVEVLAESAVATHAPTDAPGIAEVWRWREGMTAAVTTQLGGKVSEDVCVPVDRLREAIDATVAIGERHGLRACSWGHAGDGNLHSTFLLGTRRRGGARRCRARGDGALRDGGRPRRHDLGEHGVGVVKSGHLDLMWSPRALELRDQVRRQFDPKGLLNPGTKL